MVEDEEAAIQGVIQEALQDLHAEVPDALQHFTVLVVDDDPDCRELLTRRLGSRGYEPVSAASAEQARAVIARRMPDAILLDINMPSVDGISFLRELRQEERTQRIPILLISARHESSTQITGLEHGADDYVTKPFNYPVLFARLKTHLRVRALMAELEDQKRLLQKIATHDGLTGILNRRALLQALEIEMVRTLRYGRPLSVLMIDLDGFKQLNDSLGHAAGDAALREITTRIKLSLREADLVGRIGGDEFGVILPETDLEHALAVAERVRVAIGREPLVIFGSSVRIAGSVGASTLPLGFDMTPERLFARADAALYESKRLGRNLVCCYDPALGRARPAKSDPPTPFPDFYSGASQLRD